MLTVQPEERDGEIWFQMSGLTIMSPRQNDLPPCGSRNHNCWPCSTRRLERRPEPLTRSTHIGYEAEVVVRSMWLTCSDLLSRRADVRLVQTDHNVFARASFGMAGNQLTGRPPIASPWRSTIRVVTVTFLAACFSAQRAKENGPRKPHVFRSQCGRQCSIPN